MLYIKCPTCHKILGHLEIPFEEGLEKIMENPNLTPKQKQEEKIKLVNSFGIPLDRYCCRMRLITYKDLVQIVK